MKLTRTLLINGFMFGAALLLSQCKDEPRGDGQIPYDMEKAKQHIIPIEVAAKLTSIFRSGKVALGRRIQDTAYLNNNFNIPLAENFNRDAIIALLNQKGAAGVRIYLGQDAKGLVRMVLVATDAKGNDITGQDGKIMKFSANAQPAIAVEAGQRCPTLCATSSPLN